MMKEKKLVPKRRFKGFEGEWRTYNLGEKVEFFFWINIFTKQCCFKGWNACYKVFEHKKTIK